MDQQNFMNIMKSIQKMMHCPSCGSIYEINEMQFVGQRDGYFLLSMTCSKCTLPVWINVFSGQGTQPEPTTDLTVSDIGLLSREPLCADEVIDFHNFINKFDGNFKQALKR